MAHALNRGCIPTKALVQSASVISVVASASGFGVGIAGEIHHDYSVASARKDEVVASVAKRRRNVDRRRDCSIW